MYFKFPLPLLLCILFSCNSNSSGEKISESKKELSGEEQVLVNIDSLKQKAQDGDLIVRMTDDLISEHIKLLNEKDKKYSHAGLVFKNNGQLFVYNISPGEDGGDTLKMTPIDTFVNPAKNLSCALYRYDLLNQEKDSLHSLLKQYKKNGVSFDGVYDLKTNKKMYCAELIDKALTQATNNRIIIRQANIPQKMQGNVYYFFRKENISKETIAVRKIITIDNLYLRPDCQLIISFPLKYFPGQ